MKDWIKNKTIIIYILAVILLIISYSIVIQKKIQINKFAKESEQIAKANEVQTFSIDKIYLCSSANVIDNMQNDELDDMDIYQYTDIAVYINNSKDMGLTNRNTIKKLYIDNINIEMENKDALTGIVYTNLLKIGDRDEIKEIIADEEENDSPFYNNDKIEFNIVNTNAENEYANYTKPTFYADCSNPITLKYINKLNKKYSIERDSETKFDGSLLKKAGITVDDINCKIKFKINVINNDNEYHSVWVSFNVPLNDIYEGVSLKSRKTEGREYIFFNFPFSIIT